MGYLRFGRRFHIGPGLTMNLSKSGISWTIRLGPVSWNFSKRGQRRTIDLPGRGLSYVTYKSNKKKPERDSGVAAPPDPGRARPTPTAASESETPPDTIPSPGFFAPATEKRFAQGLRALLEGDTATAVERFRQADADDGRERYVADDLFAGIALLQVRQPAAAIPFLESVAYSDIELPDEIMSRYVGDMTVPVKITSYLTVDVPLSSLGAALLLAEAYQYSGDSEGAMGVMEALVESNPDDSMLRLGLAELYNQERLNDALVELTDGVTVDEDITCALLIYRAIALARQGMTSAGLDTIRLVTGDRRKRPSELMQAAFYTRGLIYEAAGQMSRARQDFEKVYAMDSSFPGVREKLQSLSGGPAAPP
ncbi:MAG: DUF4236 domain-containing protein [Anaerolineae bacterium]